MQRFGESHDRFIQAITQLLPEPLQQLFQDNFLAINHDPVTVGAVQACVHLQDQINWGVLPATCAKESLLGPASLIARAVSGKSQTQADFLQHCERLDAACADVNLLPLIHQAFALGFTQKWQGRFED